MIKTLMLKNTLYVAKVSKYLCYPPSNLKYYSNTKKMTNYVKNFSRINFKKIKSYCGLQSFYVQLIKYWSERVCLSQPIDIAGIELKIFEFEILNSRISRTIFLLCEDNLLLRQKIFT